MACHVPIRGCWGETSGEPWRLWGVPPVVSPVPGGEPAEGIPCYGRPVIVRGRDYRVEDLPQMRQESLVFSRRAPILLVIIR